VEVNLAQFSIVRFQSKFPLMLMFSVTCLCAAMDHGIICALLPLPRRLCFCCCLSVHLLATLRRNIQTDLHEIFREGSQWASEQMIKFWWQSSSWIRIWIQIGTLVSRALVEVGTVPVLLVS